VDGSDVKFFKLYLRGEEAGIWGNIRDSRYVRSQSMAQIFMTPDHMGDVHNASVT
jgi:hypothetical protein